MVVGGILVAWSMAAKSPPQPDTLAEPRLSVRVVTLAPTMLLPRVTGYGAVRPAREWRAVARVEGEVSWTAEQLANGVIVAAGAELLRIDDSDIRLTLAQIDAQSAALDVKDRTTRSSLEISKETLALAQAEVERLRELAARSVASRAAVEQVERQEIAARAAVTGYENQLALNEAERAVLKAQRDIAARSLEHVSIRAPFAVRIGEVQAETGQFVGRGQTLFAAEGVETAEVSAQFPIGRMAPLVAGATAEVSRTGPLGLRAVVRLRAPGHVIEWPASVDRVGERIDPRTQSAAVVVRVDQPLAMARPGERPPLRRDMFVEVELRAEQRPALVVPAAIVRAGRVQIVGAENRLETREVEIAFTVDGLAVVAAGLTAGDRVVVSDLAAPIDGTALAPVEDEGLAARLAATARGED